MREVKRGGEGGREGGRGSMNLAQFIAEQESKKGDARIVFRESRTASLSLFGSVVSHISSSQSG